MNIAHFMPTRILGGEDCVRQNASEFAALGKRCLIVTGRSSALKSGALQDVMDALIGQGIEYEIFDRVEPNPLLSTCYEAGRLAAELGAEFVIGIGGGSPLDAAKAIAAFATNEMEPMELFSPPFKKVPLPVAAVGTTAGTGSEVTPYSVLTVPELESKRSFTTPHGFPKVAFADVRYTLSMNRVQTVSTGLDAVCHAVESALSAKATVVSLAMAKEALGLLFPVLSRLTGGGAPTLEERSSLLYGSILAGMAISDTGTCFPHAFGYQATFFDDVPHGSATAFFLGEFLRWHVGHADERIGELVRAAGAADMEGLIGVVDSLNPPPKELTREQAAHFSRNTAQSRNFLNSIRPLDPALTEEIYLRVLGK